MEKSLLDLELPPWGGSGCRTVRAYLLNLASCAWSGEFSPKYGTIGSSDWQYELYGPMVNAGYLPGRSSYENDGYGLDAAEKKVLDDLIIAVIGELGPVRKIYADLQAIFAEYPVPMGCLADVDQLFGENYGVRT